MSTVSVLLLVGVYIYIYKYKVSVTETSAMLVVNEVERCDMGQYNITVENDLGAYSASFAVNV